MLSRFIDWAADGALVICLIAACLAGVVVEVGGGEAVGPHMVLDGGRE